MFDFTVWREVCVHGKVSCDRDGDGIAKLTCHHRGNKTFEGSWGECEESVCPLNIDWSNQDIDISHDSHNKNVIFVNQEVYERIEKNPDGIVIEAVGKPGLIVKVIGKIGGEK